MGKSMGGGISLKQSRSLGQVRQLLLHQSINMADVKLSTLLDWVSNQVKDFTFSGSL